MHSSYGGGYYENERSLGPVTPQMVQNSEQHMIQNFSPNFMKSVQNSHPSMFNPVKSEEKSAPPSIEKVMLPNFSPVGKTPMKPMTESSESAEQSSKTNPKPLGKKKVIIRKHKPAPNSRVINEEKQEELKVHSNARTEVWDWKKIQENAFNDERLQEFIQEGASVITLS